MLYRLKRNLIFGKNRRRKWQIFFLPLSRRERKLLHDYLHVSLILLNTRFFFLLNFICTQRSITLLHILITRHRVRCTYSFLKVITLITMTRWKWHFAEERIIYDTCVHTLLSFLIINSYVLSIWKRTRLIEG